ncbi:MAG TPA: DinB family protein, partial [Thermoanaerobaculia bacterium]|nr:DinB family protein [Thermoanaerobaculia bacterium]
AAFDASVAGAKKTLQETSDDDAVSTWKLTKDGKELFSSPKIGLFRAIMLNHTYHHRGQLSVYLRLLDVPVPPIYGPSADENPFG